MYDKDTIYIIGNSKTSVDNAITSNFNSFYIGFVADFKTGKIVDVSCSSTIRTTDEFVRSLFLGKSLAVADIHLEAEIKRRYHGSSQKAVVVAYKDAIKKFGEVTATITVTATHY
jgi:predicted small secreted protein